MPKHKQILDYRLVCCCFCMWISIVSFGLLAAEITNIFVLIVLFGGPAGTYWFITSHAIPPPKASVVDEILGKDLKGEVFGDYHDTIQDEPNSFIMRVVAHRFAGIEAPENSLEALELCYENGAVAVEFDLVLTSDLVPVVFHDLQLDRVTDAAGYITEMSWDEIKDIDISVKHPFHHKFPGTRIPLFDDVIHKCMEYDLRVFIDIKDDRPEVTNVILQTYEKYPKMYRRTIVSSFNGNILYSIRRADPGIVASMAWRPYYMSHKKYSVNESECIPYTTFFPTFCLSRMMDHITTWLFYNLAYDMIGFSAVLIFKDVITPETVCYWRSRNVRLFAWTVNAPLEKLHYSRNLGIGYFTDSLICD